ncbi:MAG TPA: lysine biosynthesis protein LysX [Candidatus Thermoplasmatota archaeon]|nr:lysine biosynthesis protein LysX [Candidatus Thermoplasmatota archaeon]
MTTVGMLVSRVRTDEKMILDAAERRGVDVRLLDDRKLVFDLDSPPSQLDGVDVVLERSVSYNASYYATLHLARYGVPCVNENEVVRRCGDKAETSLLLAKAGVPTPRTIVTFDEASAEEAARRLGYPVVLKPVVGSWGRLIAKAPDRETLLALVEHKTVLGGPQHGVIYIQEYVDKPGRDIRAFCIDGDAIAAIWRTNASHFITNTAQGGSASRCEVTDEVRDLCRRASDAIGGGVLAMDLMERPDGSLVCHEVNHTMEFKNSVAPTGVDIPGRILEHVLEVGKR